MMVKLTLYHPLVFGTPWMILIRGARFASLFWRGEERFRRSKADPARDHPASIEL
jgi:hypothetical protein